MGLFGWLLTAYLLVGAIVGVAMLTAYFRRHGDVLDDIDGEDGCVLVIVALVVFFALTLFWVPVMFGVPLSKYFVTDKQEDDENVGGEDGGDRED